MIQIETLLSARLFLHPQIAGERLYFISNLSGHLSLYSMPLSGGVPEALLPPSLALQNPELVGTHPYLVFPELGQIVVMVDQDGDENYQPMRIPMDGGYPEVIFPELENTRVHIVKERREANTLYLAVDSREEALHTAYRADIAAGRLEKLAESTWGCYADGVNQAQDQVILVDGYSAGDHVLYHWSADHPERRLLYGKPLEERQAGETVPINSIGDIHFIRGDRALLFGTSLFSDSYGLGMLAFDQPDQVQAVQIEGLRHAGLGEFNGFKHLVGDRYLLYYNIDGASWVYEAQWEDTALVMRALRALVGEGLLSNGVLESLEYDSASDRFSLSFSTATSPTQIYTLSGPERQELRRHTNERLLGIRPEWLAPGEDASFTSFDGLRISARLYLPSPALAFQPPYPLVYYIHGGPQSQERPDFAWFSMPLIQFLTLNGFAVFVPNVRGSSGYGLSYMKRVDRDWGGKDRLDHVHAMTEVLPNDPRLDVQRAGVVGRSYGGYMTLTLAGRHTELWKAAVDMFGPYDLLTFMERIPETWKPYFKVALGDPETEMDFLVERSPRTHLHQLGCPMLVIQGKNDPRVVEQESRDLVEALRAQGKQMDYLMFENEGHDVLKFANRVTCYNAITDFFKQHLV